MSRLTPSEWTTHIRRIAEPAADPRAPLGVGGLDGPFRAAVMGEPAVGELPADAGDGAEVGLWRARTDERIDVDRIVDAATDGPLLPRSSRRTIEVWTDADLSAMHALWWLATARKRPDWHDRLAVARDWHLANTQPDNATNRPWALHVYVLAGTPETHHYAETLLHNCMAMSARPDPLSAWILIDAARALESST